MQCVWTTRKVTGRINWVHLRVLQYYGVPLKCSCKNEFFKVHGTDCGLWSFIYSLLDALYSNYFHRNIFHDKRTYLGLVKTHNLKHCNLNRGGIKDIKLFLKLNPQLNISVSLYDGRLCPKTGNIQVWKYDTFATKKPLKVIHILHLFQFKKKIKRHYYFYLKSPHTIHIFLKRGGVV